jgi:predicted outer membrane repeat protein
MVARTKMAVSVAVLAMSAVASAATPIDVTRFDDPSGAETQGSVSLRQAVIRANATPGPDTITLHAGTYKLSLRGDDATAVAGDLDVTDALTIEGDAGGGTIIDARKARDRAFEVTAAGDLTLRHVTVKGGSAAVDGGGVFSVGTLTIESSTFTGNKARNSGGAIASEAGTCTLTDVVVTHNKAVTNDGGGCEFDVAGSATLTRVTVANNRAKDTGGGIDTDNGVTVSLTDCTVSGNKSKHEGGGLDPSGGLLTLTNSTVSGNRSAKGGGIQLESSGVVVLNNVTIVDNKAKQGGGLWTEDGSTTTLTATLVAKNTPLDCFGGLVSNGSNLIGKSDGCTITGPGTGDIVGGPKPAKPVDPHIGPLADNGGPTKTHALLPGSPAIGAVAGCPPPGEDQRGQPRTAPCDIGAFEVQ